MSADDKELSASLRQRFKPGDKVRCIDCTNTVFVPGRAYEVIRQFRDDVGDECILVDMGGCFRTSFPANWFTLAEAQPESATNAPDAADAELEKIGKLLDVLSWDEEKTTLEKVRALVLNEVHEAFDQGVARVEAIK